MASDYWEEKFWRDVEGFVYMLDWSGMLGSILAYLNLPKDASLADSTLLAIIFASSAADAFLRMKYERGIIERLLGKLDLLEDYMWRNLKKLGGKLQKYTKE